MSKEEVLLLDMWASPFCMRAKIALAEKGVAHQRQEEDLFGGKSDLLLKSNPIYQKVPVLLHNEKPICESTNIVGYIDYIVLLHNVFEAGRKIWMSKGDALEVAKKDFIEILKQLEGALGEKDYFGGDTFGFVDILAIPLTSWFFAYEKFGEFKVEDQCPIFTAWIKRCTERESVAKVIPEPEKVLECVIMPRKMNGIE